MARNSQYMDYLKKIEEAKVSGTGNPFRDGKYRAEVQKLSIFEGRKSVFFLYEFKILEVSKSGNVGRDGKEILPNAVGTTVSNVIDMAGEMGPQNIKALIAGLVGEDPDTILAEDIAEITSEDEIADEKFLAGQPAKYLKIDVEAFTRPQKTDKTKDFTHIRWAHVPPTEADLAEITKRRAPELAASEASLRG